MGPILVPLIENVKQRDTKWVCVCTTCQCERVISYAHKWNIESGKHPAECKSCQFRLGKIVVSTKGLDIGRAPEHQKKAAKSRQGVYRPKSKTLIEYRQLFAPELLSNESMKQKQSLAKKGKYGPLTSNWQGGKTSERKTAMGRTEYIELRKLVFRRDNFTCQICKVRGGKLEMDHIKEWCNYPELRYEESNCRTLCKNCHKTTDNYGHKAIKGKNGLRI